MRLPERTADRPVSNDPPPLSGNGGKSPPRQFTPLSPRLGNPKVTVVILAGVLVTASILYVSLLRPESFGFYHDDGLYVVLAKSLATGQGYRVISLPSEPDQTKSPPFYPFLLSLIWRVYPQFPQNLTWMMLLSVAATVSFLALVWRYLVRQSYATGGQALIVVAFAALNWRTIILATGIYSEMIYALLSVVALSLAEKHENESKGLLGGVALGTAMGLAFLARSSGITLLMAVAGYYLVRKRWRRALVPGLVSSLFMLGWLAWGHFHQPAADTASAGYYESYLSTFSQVVWGEGGQSLLTRFMILLSLIARNAVSLIFITVPLVCLGLGYEWMQNVNGYLLGLELCLFVMAFLFTAGGFFRFRFTGFRLLHAYVGAYVLLHILWPYSAYDRFLMPLLPWLLFFLVAELKLLAKSTRREFRSRGPIAKRLGAAVISLVLLLLGGFALYNIPAGIRTLQSSIKDKARFQEDEEPIRWLNANAASSDILVCYRDPTYYLYTGRKSIRSISARGGGLAEDSNTPVDEQVRVIFRIIEESSPQFLVLTSTDFQQEGQPDVDREDFNALIERHPENFVLVFESPDRRSRIYKIVKAKT